MKKKKVPYEKPRDRQRLRYTELRNRIEDLELKQSVLTCITCGAPLVDGECSALLFARDYYRMGGALDHKIKPD